MLLIKVFKIHLIQAVNSYITFIIHCCKKVYQRYRYIFDLKKKSVPDKNLGTKFKHLELQFIQDRFI